MRTIKNYITDYIEDFKLKTPKEKSKAIRKLMLELFVFLLIICSPAIATRFDNVVEKDLRSRVTPTLTIDQKWDLVRTGRMTVQCEDDANEELKKAGLDMSTQEGMDYAIENKLCDFALNM